MDVLNIETVGELRRALAYEPDDAIIRLYTEGEGTEFRITHGYTDDGLVALDIIETGTITNPQ